jgi:acyl carrier protein
MLEMRAGVREIFVGELGLDDETYSEELTYRAVPEWDSTSHMILAVAIEEYFNIELDSDEIVSMTSVAKIYEILQSKGVSFG